MVLITVETGVTHVTVPGIVVFDGFRLAELISRRYLFYLIHDKFVQDRVTAMIDLLLG